MKKSEQTRERILEAATRILNKRGFKDARTAELAQEAGLSEGALFRYFPSKSKLIEAVVRHYIAELHGELDNVMKTTDGHTEEEALKMIIDFHFGFFSWKESFIHNILGIASPDSIDIPHKVLFQEGLQPYVAKIAGLLVQGMENGQFRKGDPDLLATSLLGLMQIVIIRKLTIGADYSFNDAKEEVKRIFFTGILM